LSHIKPELLASSLNPGDLLKGNKTNTIQNKDIIYTFIPDRIKELCVILNTFKQVVQYIYSQTFAAKIIIGCCITLIRQNLFCMCVKNNYRISKALVYQKYFKYFKISIFQIFQNI